MNVQVTENYRITSDDRNVIVNERRIIDPTKSPNWPKMEAKGASPDLREEWREVSWHGRVEEALTSIIDRSIRRSEAETLAELIEDIRAIKQAVRDAFNTANYERSPAPNGIGIGRNKNARRR